MNRRSFLSSLVGGIAIATAIRTFPFRVFSFPTALAHPAPEIFQEDEYLLISLPTKEALRILQNNLKYHRDFDYYSVTGQRLTIKRPQRYAAPQNGAYKFLSPIELEQKNLQVIHNG